MPQIGWFEILIIVAVAIIVIGPKDFPFMLKKIGSWIGSIKRYINNIQQEVSNLEDENFEQDSQEKNNKKPIDNEQK
jgi:sec-independent protein translocase protein TatB